MRHTMNTREILASRSLVVRALVLAVGLLAASVPGVVRADQPLQTMTVGFQNGTITAVYQTTFQIDGRTYSLVPDAEIFDDKGNQIDAGSIRADIEVKFHAKKDQNDKIDKMILIFPR